ncbi:CBS domain-containing protein [bacterium]|nr:CBS domain-containing protein [bacterium]
MELDNIFIGENATVLEAMDQLDRNAKKVLFLTKDNKLLASITDGDIRRWILQKGDLNATIKYVANYNPKFLTYDLRKNAIEYMKKYSIEAVPIVDENNNIVSISFRNEEFFNQQNTLNIPVVIMAGGLGKRLYPYTKILPKPLIPIGDIPIIEHIMNRFNNYGCDDFYLIVNHKKKMIKAYFNEIEKKFNVHYADEDKPLGTGGGLSLLKNKVTSTFILSNCDNLIDVNYEKIFNHHVSQNNFITMVCSLKKINIPYGVVDITENGELDKFKEKPKLSFFTNAGLYIVNKRIIEELEENKCIGFPEIIEQYKAQGEKIGVYPISDNDWLDMGQIEELEEMRKRLGYNE